MELNPDFTKKFARIQRTPNGTLLSACIALGADDLVFVDSTTEILEIYKKQIDGGLILEIRSVDHDMCER